MPPVFFGFHIEQQFSAQAGSKVPVLSHIVLYSTDLQQSLNFYQEALEMKVTEKAQSDGETRYFLSNNKSHHQLVLVKNKATADTSKRAIQQIAFNVPDHTTLLRLYKRLKGRNNLELKDNQISWSIYLKDPDNNEVEIYWDTRDQPFGSRKWNGQTANLSEEALLRGSPN